MKKIVYSLFAISLTIGVFAQEAADRKVQAGLVFGTGVNFQKSNTKNFKVDGATANLSVGAVINIGFNNNIGLSTGLEFDFDNLKYTPNVPMFYDYNDTKIFRNKEDKPTTHSIFKLEKRKQQTIGLTVPTMLIFRTNYMGYFRYFGKFGLRNNFLLSSKSNDIGTAIDPLVLPLVQEQAENTGMKLNSGNDMVFYKGSVGLAGGAEWNFAGATCLALEVGFYYGFTPLYYNPKDDKRVFYTPNSSSTSGRDYLNNAAHQSQLLFKLSILF